MIKDFTDLIANISKFSGVYSDSRMVTQNSIFVATKGGNVDGHDFIEEAVKNGAAVVLGEKDIVVSEVPYIKVENSKLAMGLVASEYYGNPSTKLKLIGVTGTKGKTTTTHMIYHTLSGLGKKVGMISSIVAKIGDKEADTGFHVTSPDVVSLHNFLNQMVEAGCEYAVIEVSSHGIDQNRIAGVNFEVSVLTNIAPEHLDYHKTFKEYKRVKMSFINSAKFKVIAPHETDLNIFPGMFNNLNAVAAVTAVEALGFKKSEVINAISSFKLPKGRLEEVENDLGLKIIVDFAHTPDSLLASLKYLKTITTGRLISVFGCAGERDTKKRRKMGKLSGEIADLSVFTAEDPRSENITDIFRAMKSDSKNYICIPERGEAIAYALSVAKKGDTVAFFGKGHERSMAYKGYEHSWSDQDEIRNFLHRDKSVSAIILAAGKGSRMKSVKPKILHEICGRPMVSYSLQNLRRAGVGEIVGVVCYRKNLVIKQIGGLVKIAVQKNPKGGTADAASYGLSLVDENVKKVMVLYGDDTAFYSPSTINGVLNEHDKNNSVLTFITLVKQDPKGLGRIVRDKNGDLLGIVEEKDATDAQRKINEVNDGLYVFDKKWFIENLAKVKKSSVTGELYIVELIKMAIDQKQKVIAHQLLTDVEWQGINTQEELKLAEEKMKERLTSFTE